MKREKLLAEPVVVSTLNTHWETHTLYNLGIAAAQGTWKTGAVAANIHTQNLDSFMDKNFFNCVFFYNVTLFEVNLLQKGPLEGLRLQSKYFESLQYT